MLKTHLALWFSTSLNKSWPRTTGVGLVSLVLGAMPLFAQGYLSALESNKKVVFDFYRLVVEPRNADLIELYISPDFLDHDPSEQKGAENIAKMLKAMGPAGSEDVGSTLRNPPAYIMAEGDLVTWLFKHTVPDPKDKSKTTEQFTLEAYRIKDRKIVEHWKGSAGLP
jgi:predicted SnoaL-like aldol condensation-catalyzing enzyme